MDSRPTPINEYMEDRVREDGKLVRVILTYPKYHRDGLGYLQETDCTIVESREPGWDWEVTKGIWALRIKNDGTYQSLFNNHVITRIPIGVGYYNTATREFAQLLKLDVSKWRMEVAGDTITWTHPQNDIVYKVIYIHDQARAVFEFPQKIQEWLYERQPKGSLRADLQVCIIYDADIDFLSEDTDTEYPIRCEEAGRVIKIGGQFVTHENFELRDDREIAELSWPRRKVYLADQKKYIEACSIEALESGPGKLIFNDSDTFQQGVDGYAGCEDNYLYAGAPNTNYGNSGIIAVDGIHPYYGLIRFNLTGEITKQAVINSATLYMRVHSYTGPLYLPMTIFLYGCWKPWQELDSSWNQWDKSGNKEWGTAGADNMHDDGPFNSGDGTGYDRRNTYDSYNHIYATDLWTFQSWNVTPFMNIQSHAMQWDGWVIRYFGSHTGYVYFNSCESALVGARPYLEVTYTSSSSSSSSYSSSASGSYSCSSSSCSSSFSSSSFSSSCSSCSSYSSSFAGPYYVRADALGGSFGEADNVAQALTAEEFRLHNAVSPSTYYIKGKYGTCDGLYVFQGPFDYSLRAGIYAQPLHIKGFLTNGPTDQVTGGYRPRLVMGPDVSLSSSSSSASCSSSSSTP